MKATSLVSLIAAAVSLSSVGIAMADDAKHEYRMRQSNAERHIVQAAGKFSADMYRRLAAAGSGNLIVSPLSVHLVLTALSSAADGENKAELQRVLSLGDAAEEDYKALLQQLNRAPAAGNGPAYSLSLANAAWLKKAYPIKEAFREFLQLNYSAELTALDFAEKVDAAEQINKWAADHTAQRIKDMVSPAAIDPLTRLILTNAVYFKSRWENRFERRVTRVQPFYAAGGVLQVPLMNDVRTVPYYEDEELQVLELPYVGRELSMVVVLPREKHGLTKFEQSLTADQIDRWLNGMRAIRADYHIPRFSFSNKFELSESLKALGISRAFDLEHAAFPGITEQERLALSLIIHQTFIAVDEEGTEAAAATAAMMAGSAYVPDPPKSFRADHPFLFFIFHKSTKAILFIGRLAQP